MLPQVAYWTHITAPGITLMLRRRSAAGRGAPALSAAMRTANPGPWLDGDAGIGAVIADGRLEAVMMTARTRR
jgi:hypothetical protein